MIALTAVGCAKYNTYYNAKKEFDAAEHVRDEAIRKNEDPPPPTGAVKNHYDMAIQKAQKILDEYPGHSLTDDALFLQAKSWHRLESYRMSIKKLDLLFQNFPATDYEEEALYLQGLNFLLIGAVSRSQEYLDRLVRQFPESHYRAEVLKVSGDNAYALESWAEAAVAYRDYLDQPVKLQERDRIGLRLAECFWELEDYEAAAEILGEVGTSAESRELRFRARLLQAQVHVRIGDYATAAVLTGELKTEASLYKAQGEVRLIEAESLIRQGRSDEGAPLLENIPKEWETPTVLARANDMLGYLYLERGDWERAGTAFRAALRRRTDLDEPERTRALQESLRDYLAADQQLADARGEKVARLKLLQANAMMFGFDRPATAAVLYTEAATDTAAKSTVAVRALYGAYLAYRDGLDHPDSAAIFRDRLEDEYPASPQAYEVRLGAEGDLLGYLLTLRQEEQMSNFSALSDSERVALVADFGEETGAQVAAGRARGNMRRRMVFLQRRDHLVYAPSAGERDLAQQRRAVTTADSLRLAPPDTTATGAAGVFPPPPGSDPGMTGAGAVTPVPVGAADRVEEGAVPVVEEDPGEEPAAEEEEEEEEEKSDAFDLR